MARPSRLPRCPHPVDAVERPGPGHAVWPSLSMTAIVPLMLGAPVPHNSHAGFGEGAPRSRVGCPVRIWGAGVTEYRIEDLARVSGATVRNIRAYQDRGLLPRPGRRGRSNVYDDSHLARLRQITGLLERGYTLASIKELLEAWDSGRGLDGVLDLLSEVDGPWSDEVPARLTRARLADAFPWADDQEAMAEAVALGVLEPEGDDTFRVPSPRLLAAAAELHSAGVPLRALCGHLRELRGQVEAIARNFLDFIVEHLFRHYLDRPLSDADAAEAAQLVRRLRPLAQVAVDAELARAMRDLATHQLQSALDPRLRTAVGRPEESGSGRPALDRVPMAAVRSAKPAERPEEGQVLRVELTVPEETAALLRVLLAHAGPPRG